MFEKWEKTKRLILMPIKRCLSDTIGNTSNNGNTKDFMNVIGEKYKESEKAD